jgi:hypothetical protein
VAVSNTLIAKLTPYFPASVLPSTLKSLSYTISASRIVEGRVPTTFSASGQCLRKVRPTCGFSFKSRGEVDRPLV